MIHFLRVQGKDIVKLQSDEASRVFLIQKWLVYNNLKRLPGVVGLDRCDCINLFGMAGNTSDDVNAIG